MSSTARPFTEDIRMVTIGALSTTGVPSSAAAALRPSIWSSWMSKKIRFGLPRVPAPSISRRSVVRARKSVRTRNVPRPRETSRRTVRLFGRCRFSKPWRTT